MELSQVSTKELEAELRRRQSIKEKEEREKIERQTWLKWEQRPKCLVVGRAYGRPGGEEAQECVLATLTIKGNASQTYHVCATVAPSVETYFNNALTDEDRAELHDQLYQFAEQSILNKCSDPAIVTTLICLSEVAGIRPLDKRKQEIYDEWHKEAVARLMEFSKDELIQAKNKLVANRETAHGQVRLLDEVIAKK